MLLSVAADERAALQFDDLASALDAGLSVDSLGGSPAGGERAVHDLLRARGVKLSTTEDAVLLAAWRAGRITVGLRNRAEQRRERAVAAREVWRGLRYPLFLLVFLTIASLIVGSILGNFTLFYAVLALDGTLAAAIWFVRRGVRSGSERWLRVPFLGGLLQDLGELPYLETLHAMYGAGVPLLAAHEAAVGAVPVLGVQQRLRIAHRQLGEGRSLTEALQAAVALNPETRSLLATGEKSGQLEETLHKALRRRRDVVARGISDSTRWAGVVAYGIAICGAVYYIWWIYATTLGKAMGAIH
ncbi:MAG: type II secretion system F family protein [Planctomycetes bacterium]|nr:type II secretion system F family protein [Planctomycetota bacterium]